MSRHPWTVFLKSPASQRIEIGGNTAVAEAFLPGAAAAAAAIRIGEPRKRDALRRARGAPRDKRRGSAG